MKESSSPVWGAHESSFSSVLHTNYTPSPEEIAKLKTLLVAPQLDLSRVESKIKHLQTTLDELKAKRDALNAFIDAHRALMSPIRQLPPETLSEIFTRCLPTDGHPVRDLEEAPLLLTVICRGWREIAMKTPAIWSRLHIVIPQSFSSALLSRRMTGTTMWLERSGSLPISLSVFSDFGLPLHPRSDGFAIGTEFKVESFIEPLLRFIPRLAEFALQGSPQLLSSIVPLLPETLPSLISLHLRNREDHWHGQHRTHLFRTLVSRAPSLKQLTLDGYPKAASQYLTLRCGWEALTHLTLHPDFDFHGTSEPGTQLGPIQILDILLLTPRLQALDVSLIVSSTSLEAEGKTSVVFLNHLQEMKFTFRNDRDLDDEDQTRLTRTGALIESSIICPSLKLLSVISAIHSIAGLAEFPFSSGILGKVETLILLGISITSAASTRCLSLAPNLISLEMHDVGYWESETSAADPPAIPDAFIANHYVHTVRDSHLASLTPSPTNPLPLCPKLQHFTLLMDQPLGYSEHTQVTSTDALLSFIESRTSSHAPTRLSSCDVLLPQERYFSQDSIRRLCEMRDGGLKLRVRVHQAPPLVSQDLSTTGVWTPQSVSERMEMRSWGSDSIV